MRADSLILVATRFPHLSSSFDSERTLLHEPDRGQREQRELQVLRLPVLRHGLPEVGRAQVAPEADRSPRRAGAAPG